MRSRFRDLALVCYLFCVALERGRAEEVAPAENASCLLQKATRLDFKEALDEDHGDDAAGGVAARHATMSMAHDRNMSLLSSRTHAAVNAKAKAQGLAQLIIKEIEFEMNLHKMGAPQKSKILLVLLQMIGLCGVDRCYMGQPCLGILKAFTFAGFGFWGIIDYVVVTCNALNKSPSIDSFGFFADFNPADIEPAFYIACIMLALLACSFICSCCSACLTVLGGGILAAAGMQELEQQSLRRMDGGGRMHYG